MMRTQTLGAWAALTAALWAAPAWAGVTNYSCDGGATLQLKSTPQAATVRVEGAGAPGQGQDWPLRRVMETGGALYFAPGKKASLRVQRAQAVWQVGDAPALNCELKLNEFRARP